MDPVAIGDRRHGRVFSSSTSFSVLPQREIYKHCEHVAIHTQFVQHVMDLVTDLITQRQTKELRYDTIAEFNVDSKAEYTA